jgi:Na+-transporting NADH:ubiquinone oxidoreductase subunit F
MILRALLFSNAFALTIGLIILFMDKVINNYGICSIIINDDKEIHVKGGSTLLRLLFESKYFIPSACGGKGTCGYCKLQITEGGGPALPTEKLILTPFEQKQGFRLGCQLKVKNDLHIKIPEEYLNIKEYTGTVTLSKFVTDDIKRIKIRLPEKEELKYKPGQYIQIKFPTDDGVDFRAYSMASNPTQTTEVEINVKLIPDGLGSSYAHSKNEGDEFDFSGPYGDFFLRTDSHREIICVAGGVGLAPLKSIILYCEEHQIQRTVYLFYGARKVDQLYDHDYFSQLAENMENFHYYPALSEPDENWNGENGFIHSVIDKKIEQGINGEAYLCGPPIMIEAVNEILDQKGIPKERIWYDKF